MSLIHMTTRGICSISITCTRGTLVHRSGGTTGMVAIILQSSDVINRCILSANYYTASVLLTGVKARFLQSHTHTHTHTHRVSTSNNR